VTGDLGGSVTELAETIAAGCRVLAAEGVVTGTLGHISARVGDRMLIRCRGRDDRGLLFATADEVRLVDFDGCGDDADAGYRVPNELPIHGELYRARPDVAAVVHAHPPALLVAGLAGLPLRPLFGAYNIPAARLAADGIPVWPRSALVRRPDLAHQMIAAMGDRPVCVLRGHGVTVTGDSVEQAVIRTLDLDALARVTLELARLGCLDDVPDLSAEDVAELPDLGAGFNDSTAWRHYLAKVEATQAARAPSALVSPGSN
jgi:ribulose-5-phosphate 4-epimerase/fuculose-1-phosphate aldolase